MNKGWIKLYRALLDNKLIRDNIALQIFVYLLLSADRQGRVKVSRFRTAEFLKMPPSTFRNGLKRLEIGQRVDSISTTSYTLISILNWDRYQSLSTGSKSKIGQPEDTITRIKNKERYYNSPKLPLQGSGELSKIGDMIKTRRNMKNARTDNS